MVTEKLKINKSYYSSFLTIRYKDTFAHVNQEKYMRMSVVALRFCNRKKLQYCAENK